MKKVLYEELLPEECVQRIQEMRDGKSIEMRNV